MMCPECKGDYKHNSRFLLHLLGRLPEHYQMDKKEKDKFFRRLDLGEELIGMRQTYAYCWHDTCYTYRREDEVNYIAQITLINQALKLTIKLAENVLNGFDFNYTNAIETLLVKVGEIPDGTVYFDPPCVRLVVASPNWDN